MQSGVEEGVLADADVARAVDVGLAEHDGGGGQWWAGVLGKVGRERGMGVQAAEVFTQAGGGAESGAERVVRARLSGRAWMIGV